MGYAPFVNELWKNKKSDVMSFILQIRAWEYRHLPSIYRVNKPTRPEKAKRLGYKKKNGFIIYRVKVRRGGRKKPVKKGVTNGKPKNQGINEQKFQRNKKSIAEEKVGKVCGNLRILNSYWINQDSIYKYFEVILVDPFSKTIKNDWKIRWICFPSQKHREMRGLTSSGKKSRGLRKKGHKATKSRPSRRGAWRRNNKISLRRYR